MSRRVTFSRNVTLSLSRTCVSHCKYCAFQTHQTHLHAPDEVLALLDRAAKRSVKELLILTGDDPAHHAGVKARLAELGFEDFVGYVVWCCERALERGLLPHTNLGAVTREELARLREVTASQGLMLESTRDDLVAHQGSPTKDPALRLQTIRAAGELRIPFTSGILVGIGERAEDRDAALRMLADARSSSTSACSWRSRQLPTSAQHQTPSQSRNRPGYVDRDIPGQRPWGLGLARWVSW